MTDMPELRSVTLKRTFDAPIDLVFRACSEGEHIRNWMKCDADATLDITSWEVRVGGAIDYKMAKPGVFEARTTGRVIEVDPPRVFAFTSDPDPGFGTPELTVRFELAEVEGGKTELTLTHSGLPGEEMCNIVTGGWTNGLAMLGELVEAQARDESTASS